MQNTEILGNFVLPTKDVTNKFFFSAGFYITLCTIHFYDLFAKYQNSMKNTASGKKIVNKLQGIIVGRAVGFPLPMPRNIVDKTGCHKTFGHDCSYISHFSCGWWRY